MARKTIEVAWLKEKVNHFLKHSKDEQVDARLANAALLEMTLMETGNYKGFNYIAWLDGGYDQWRADGSPSDNTKYLGDQTRRMYY